MTIGRIPSVEGGIQPTIVDAKGDLIAATAADTVNRLAVGSNDQVLVADSSTSTGLAWKSYGAQFVAGKNKIINGDFGINQRSFTSTTTSTTYGFDRWKYIKGGTVSPTVTYSAQTFTAGTAPVAGYEGINFARMATTTGSSSDEYSILQQPIEDVRTFAGQTVTFSFWAKASSGTPKVGVELWQAFGAGGSAATGPAGQSVTISTSWARYSVTISVPSLSGKTIGTNSNLEANLWCSAGSTFNSRSGSVGNQTATIDFWGIQIEAGSVATPFTTATGTLQGELAAAQRYYRRMTAGGQYTIFANGATQSTTAGQIQFPLPPMRVLPTSVEYSTLRLYDNNSATAVSSLTINTQASNADSLILDVTCTGAAFTGQRPAWLTANNSTSAYIGFSSEL